MTHEDKVRQLASLIKSYSKGEKPLRFVKKGVSHVVPLPKDKRSDGITIDISCLSQIIQIDPASMTCTVEPGVTFGELVSSTLCYNLIPPVVPELEGITIGGAVAGCSVESMSFRYGGFHDNALEYEVITGLGDTVTCSREKESLLFEMMHGSYGTLGLLTKITFKLIPAKRFVRLEYRRLPNVDAFYKEMLTRVEEKDYDFIDGIIHSRNQFVLCLGSFVDNPPYTTDYKRTKIYYKSTLERQEDFMTTKDYFFRYDTECHWLTRTFPPLQWTIIRYLFGKWLLGSTNLISNAKRLEKVLSLKRRPDVVCDVFIPIYNFCEFYRWYEDVFNYYPLWVVPYRVEKVYPWVSDVHRAKMKDTLFIDCAIYGKENTDKDVDYSVLLEEKTFELAGIKTLIGRNHYTEERFWEIYNRANWEAVKQLSDPNHVFPDLYEKFGKVG